MMLAVALASAALSSPGGADGAAPFSCGGDGTTIPHSNRSTAATACVGVQGSECAYECEAGYLRIGRHVCQNYSTMGVNVIHATFFGGRCEKLCGATAADWSCGGALVPVRHNSSGGGADGSSPCLNTTCLTPTEALTRLARGNYDVWRLGRHNRTGMYIDHVNPLLTHAQQQWNMASADSAGPGLAVECVAAALGLVSLELAAERVLLTLRSFSGLTPGFVDMRNDGGWLPTFMNPDTGACLSSPTLGCLFSTDSTAFNTAGVLFAKTFFERTAPGAPSTAEISRIATLLYRRVQWR
eukprot:COSAG01_NODE_1116_length_11642_cov_7.561899_10_plen_298_part_00